MEFIVYAAGPIADVSYDGCTEWRARLQQKFDDIVKTGDRIRVASPMRGKEYFAGADVMSQKRIQDELVDEFRVATSSNRAIMSRDSFDCRRSHLVFANLLGAKKVSIGTVMECCLAWDRHIPIVAAIEKDNPHHHPMLDETFSVQLEDFDTAVLVAANILLPNLSGVREEDWRLIPMPQVSSIWGMGGLPAPNPLVPFVSVTQLTGKM